MTTVDLLAMDVPAAKIATILGVTPRQVRKMRKGSKLALSRVATEVDVPSTVVDEEDKWRTFRDECRVRDEALKARRAFRLLFESTERKFEDAEKEARRDMLEQVEAARQRFIAAKTQADNLGIKVEKYGKMDEHIAKLGAMKKSA